MGQGELLHEGHPHVVVSSDRFSQFLYRVSTRSPRWAGPLAILLCFAGGVSYTLAVHADGYDAFTSPTCIVKLTTGFDCPGCGGTRALWFLLHGDLPAAARSHLMAVFAAPFLAYAYLAWAVNVVTRGRRLPTLRLSPIAISLFLLAWGAFSVLRNLPWAPFTWLFV
jgi:hypothetical protein